jgi:hypothetical protein
MLPAMHDDELLKFISNKLVERPVLLYCSSILEETIVKNGMSYISMADNMDYKLLRGLDQINDSQVH